MSGSRHLSALFVMVVVLASCAALAQQKPIRLMAEAEDFKVEKKGWEVLPYRKNYYASTFAVTFLSRMGCLSAPTQTEKGKETVATQEVEIPADGTYWVMARYEQPFNFSVEFDIEVKQGRKTVYRGKYGRLKDPKIWSMVGHKRIPMARYFWGGTDNIVWQGRDEMVKAPVALRKGRATIRLIAGPQMDGRKPRLNAAERHVDVICITNDEPGWQLQLKTLYLEGDGWLVQDGDLFIRFTNPKENGAPIAPRFGGAEIRSPHKYGTAKRDWPGITVLKAGWASTARNYIYAGPRSLAVSARHVAPELPLPAKVTPDLKLPPGATSGWIPVGQCVDAAFDSNWTLACADKRADGKAPVIGLEIAIPDGKGGLKTMRKMTVTAGTKFSFSGCVAPNADLRKKLEDMGFPPRIWTVQEALENLRNEIKKFPKVGSRPKRFPIYNIMGWGGRGRPVCDEISRMLGDNTYLPGGPIKRAGIFCHWGDRRVESIVKAAVEGKFKDLLVLSYGDETHIYPVQPTDEQFAAWLKERGVKHGGPAKYTTVSQDPLFYYSQICGKEIAGRHFAAASAEFTKMGAYTGANYSPHGNYLVSDVDYIRPFKMRAMTMPWSEDYVWQVPEFSVQVMGYLVSAFRAGAKYHNQPIHMYVMPHSPGNTPRDFRLSFYTAVAHGTKMINYFCASPDVVTHSENHIAVDDLAMWRAVYDTTRETGILEDYVLDGKVRPARTAILLSSVDEILSGENNQKLAIHNNERKAVYYALRHAQVPVDFLAADDVIDGLATGYKVIYVTQEWLHSNAVKALTKWVGNGGTLVAFAGGGFANEFDRPNPDANALYGVKQQKVFSDPDLARKIQDVNMSFLSKQDLPLYEPFDYVSWGEGERAHENVGVIVRKQTLVPGDGTVIGKFKNGKPAVIEKRHGKGRAVLFGFLPGQAYLKSGLPIRPADRGATDDAFTHFLPTDMDVGLRRGLVDEFLPPSFVRPVVCGEPLVETTCIDTAKPKKRLAVPLMNYTGKPIAELTVTVRGVKKVRAARSVKHEKLDCKFQDGNMIVTLSLDVADMLLVDL